MKLTIEQQAALGRMSYSIRALTNGLRSHHEDFDLVIRAMIIEAINLCLVKYHGRSLTSGQAEFAGVAEECWEMIALNHPELSKREHPDVHKEGGN